MQNNWQSMDTAPKDGTDFLAYCIERGPFSPGPTYRYDIARWSARSPDDRIGYWMSRTGAIVTYWMPLPKPPAIEAEQTRTEGK